MSESNGKDESAQQPLALSGGSTEQGIQPALGLTGGSEPVSNIREPEPQTPKDADPVDKFLDQLQRVVKSKWFVATLGVFLLLELFLRSGDARGNLVDFIDEDLREPMAQVAPLEIAGNFVGRVADCDDNQGCGIGRWVWNFPGAVIGTTGDVLEEGLAGIIVIGIPLVMLIYLASKDEDSGWLLAPQGWLVAALFVGVFGWLLQAALLLILLAVKQTILFFGFIVLLRTILGDATKFIQWFRDFRQAWFKPKPAQP